MFLIDVTPSEFNVRDALQAASKAKTNAKMGAKRSLIDLATTKAGKNIFKPTGKTLTEVNVLKNTVKELPTGILGSGLKLRRRVKIPLAAAGVIGAGYVGNKLYKKYEPKVKLLRAANDIYDTGKQLFGG
jgi:hypothetical protein